MGSVDYISYGFALVVLSGGVIGYMKAGSTMSLASGVVFGGLLAYGASRTSANPSAFMVSLVVSTVLFGLMGYRYMNSGKFMPAGLVAILSLGQVLRFAVKLF